MELRWTVAMLVLVSCATLSEKERTIVPFTTDGCSYFPDGTNQEPTLWRHCCVQHDLYYWAGGTLEQKQKADRELGECVTAAGHFVIGNAMEKAVGWTGTPIVPTTFRWGYGWSFIREYAPWSADDVKKMCRVATPDQAKRIGLGCR